MILLQHPFLVDIQYNFWNSEIIFLAQRGSSKEEEDSQPEIH